MNQMYSSCDKHSEDVEKMLQLCKACDWSGVLQCIRRNHVLATSPMRMSNHVTTTVLHQVISSKDGAMEARKNLALGVLEIAGASAVTAKNGYGSLPLHVILQRNMKMDTTNKELLAFAMIEAYPDSLLVEGSVSKRTPLHIAFTDYTSKDFAKFIIERGRGATAMRDRNGWLPIHVACSRHVSPAKLQMLLEANPESLLATTDDGESILHLAIRTATKAHPNFSLIATIKQLMQEAGVDTDAMMNQIEARSRPAKKASRKKHRVGRKRRHQVQPDADAANLLLHFHQNVSMGSPSGVEEV